ncbi:DUF1097 domain-containing protein [Alteraurantiacibacter aquimixticola]|uniref:DUF1097 domain-containing protein n=1 Tax=Alteraurantiacibacter aquimixticola TaxID=2489173 RepID=A0A4T3F174_9SPHN|nr:DUF1097 domain-containing protein [Alteraurantiacibacter aquimixticola]TIX50923.1 DUF1097 domain-containing protein [Alteraurantiacibacter aquimixticola]
MPDADNQTAGQPNHPRQKFILWTVIASAVAALAAWLSEALALEVWIMFAGFIAWFTRPTSFGNSLSAMLCLWLGVAIGAGSGALTGALIPVLGQFALPVVVFAVALVIVGLRNHHIAGNMLAWFLGMVTWFAASLDIVGASLLNLAGATAIGGLAGYTCQALNRRWAE